MLRNYRSSCCEYFTDLTKTDIMVLFLNAMPDYVIDQFLKKHEHRHYQEYFDRDNDIINWFENCRRNV